MSQRWRPEHVQPRLPAAAEASLRVEANYAASREITLRQSYAASIQPWQGASGFVKMETRRHARIQSKQTNEQTNLFFVLWL